MPKLNGPLFSLEAKGTTKKTISYQNRPSGSAVTKYSKPGTKNPFNPSYKQQNQRTIMALLIAQWQSMTDLEKLNWENAALIARTRAGGYAHFLKIAQKNLYRDHGLALYYSYNEPITDTITDLSGNGNNAQNLNDAGGDLATQTPSKNQHYGSALDLTPIQTYHTTPSHPTLNFGTGNFTLEFLFYPTSGGTSIPIITKGITTNTVPGFRYRTSVGGTYSMSINNGTTTKSATLQPPPLNNWTHVAITVTRGVETRGYYNGVSVGSTSLAGYEGSLDNNIALNAKVLPIVLLFKIDELRLYNRALTPTEILKHANMYKISKT